MDLTPVDLTAAQLDELERGDFADVVDGAGQHHQIDGIKLGDDGLDALEAGENVPYGDLTLHFQAGDQPAPALEN